jgi:uncharacterized tellurite resistance protein B-like protein
MLDAIRSLLRGEPATPDPGARAGADPLHVAACVLLLEIAHADGEFSDAERAHLESVLARHFGLDTGSARELMTVAESERQRSVDDFRFTSVLLRSYDLGQKMVLAEVMWGMVLADGTIADHEHYLTRKISNLLELPPAYLSSAKAAAEQARDRT